MHIKNSLKGTNSLYHQRHCGFGNKNFITASTEQDGMFCQATTSVCLEQMWVHGLGKNWVWLWGSVDPSSALPHWSPRDSEEHQACTKFNLLCPYGTAQCPFIIETEGFTAVCWKHGSKLLVQGMCCNKILTIGKLRSSSFHLKKSSMRIEMSPDTCQQVWMIRITMEWQVSHGTHVDEGPNTNS